MKIIQNDINIAHEFYNFRIENQHFNFCVGETVFGHLLVTFYVGLNCVGGAEIKVPVILYMKMNKIRTIKFPGK